MLKKIGLSVLGVPALLLGLAAHPAQAKSRVHVQFGVGYPVYSYPYNAYDYYGYPYVPYTPYYGAPGYVVKYPHGYYWVGRHGHIHRYHHGWR